MNDPWLESWLECQRIYERMRWRIQVWQTRRRLPKLERTLGELGWQQADFDPRDPIAINLQTAEKKQARLLFDIAETKEQIAELKATSQEKTDTLLTAIVLAQDTANRSETQALQLLASLELERSRQAPLYLLESIQKTIAEEENSLRQSRADLSTQKTALTLHQADLQNRSVALEKNLQSLEAEKNAVLEKKSTHFAQIGRELADSRIAPLNQPESLTQVLALRDKIGLFHSHIAHSLILSRELSWLLRSAAYGFCTIGLFAGGLLLFLLVALGIRLFHN